jgi:hypothetical protein
VGAVGACPSSKSAPPPLGRRRSPLPLYKGDTWGGERHSTCAPVGPLLHLQRRRPSNATAPPLADLGFRNPLRMSSSTTLVRESNPRVRSSRVRIFALIVTVLRHIDLGVGKSSCEFFVFRYEFQHFSPLIAASLVGRLLSYLREGI